MNNVIFAEIFFMTILTSHQIRAVEAYTIEHEPVSSIDLMERAAIECADFIGNFYCRNSKERKIVVFAGPGNNGGDGLAIARILRMMDYEVPVYLLTEKSKLSPNALINYNLLKDAPVVLTEDNLPELEPSTYVVDAMFGTGLSRPLDGLAAKTVAHINKSDSVVLSIDLPSGLFCEDNTENNIQNTIIADVVLTMQQPKLSFFFADSSYYVGSYVTLDIGFLPEAIMAQNSNYQLMTRSFANDWLFETSRNKFSHKGDFGHALLIAGSSGMMGSCVLATKGCLRAGVGLVTAHIPKDGNIIMQTSVPEAMVSLDENSEFFTKVPDLSRYNAIAVGPGIGKNPETQQALLALITEINAQNNELSKKQESKFQNKRLVLDADALNILSENPDWLNLLPPNSILTPHPGEFDRLAGKSKNCYQRHLKQIEMAKKYSVYIILKGAYTSIATPDGNCFFNETGNPGMATAGSGDVLTGIIVSLLAQRFVTDYVACMSVWLHGLAGDIAERKTGQIALIASDIVNNIGKAIEESKSYIEDY